MKITKTKLAGLVLAALILGACGNTSTRGSGSNSGSDDSESPADAATLGAASQDLFGGLGDQQALHVEGHEEVAWDFCGQDINPPDGITMSNLVSAGHYGRSSAGHTVEADFECDSTAAETTYKSWSIAEAIIMDCTGGDMSFTGNGIVQVLVDTQSMNFSGKVYGSFALPDGAEARCDIEFSDSSFESNCETDTEEGVQPLDPGSQENVCSQPE